MIKPNTQKDYVKTALRLPPDLHADLHVAAKVAERGLNAEMIFRLRQSLKGKRNLAPSMANSTTTPQAGAAE